MYVHTMTKNVENFYMKMKRKGEYKYFREGASLASISRPMLSLQPGIEASASLATQLIEEQIQLDMTLDGIQVNGWNIFPLVEPMVNFLRIT